MNFQANQRYIMISILCLFLGWMFYVFGRGFDPLGLITSAKNMDLPLGTGAIPTLLHAVAFYILLRLAFVSTPSFWFAYLGSTAGYEVAQFFFPGLGVFDWHDLLAVGFVIVIFRPFTLTPRGISSINRNTALLLRSMLLILAAATSIASATGPYGKAKGLSCVNKDEFRSAFKVEEPRPIKNAGKIYRIGPLLLVGEPLIGIHVFDNSDPYTPLAKSFINIPGNIDLIVKSPFLYADSGVDLLTIKITLDEIILVHRLENLFDLGFSSCAPDQIEAFPAPYYDGDDFKKRIEENRNEN